MLLIVPLAAQYAGTIELLDRTDVRARSTEQLAAPAAVGPGAPPAAAGTGIESGIDFVTTAGARLRLYDRRWEWTLSYSPSLIIPDVIPLQSLGLQQPEGVQLLHVGSAGVSWHSRLVHVSLTEAVSYGELNSAFLNQPQAPAGQPLIVQTVPAPQTIQFGSSNTDGVVSLQLGRMASGSVGAGYMLS
ncbi:MAG: hypothetical protein ACREJ3_08915, partial [Polyangiaceae bacterium]